MKPNLVSFSEASKYIYHSKTLLVDLRSREAFATSHISGAWNIPYEELSQYQEEMMNYDRIIFYCDHGNHSLQAARELAKKGKWASSIAGGYEEIKKLPKSGSLILFLYPHGDIFVFAPQTQPHLREK